MGLRPCRLRGRPTLMGIHVGRLTFTRKTPHIIRVPPIRAISRSHATGVISRSLLSSAWWGRSWLYAFRSFFFDEILARGRGRRSGSPHTDAPYDLLFCLVKSLRSGPHKHLACLPYAMPLIPCARQNSVGFELGIPVPKPPRPGRLPSRRARSPIFFFEICSRPIFRRGYHANDQPR